MDTEENWEYITVWSMYEKSKKKWWNLQHSILNVDEKLKMKKLMKKNVVPQMSVQHIDMNGWIKRCDNTNLTIEKTKASSRRKK